MEAIKLMEGWKILGTNELVEFGQISLDVYNYEHFVLEETYKSLRKLFHEPDIKKFDIISRYYPRCNFEEELFQNHTNIIALISSNIDLCHDPKLSYIYKYGYSRRLEEKRYAYPIDKDWVRKLSKNSNDNGDFLLQVLKNYSVTEKRCRLLEALFNDKLSRNYTNHDEYLSFITDIIKSHFNDRISQLYKLETIPRWYNTKLYRAYIINDLKDLYFDDFAEIVNCEYGVSECPICKELFIQKDKRKNFCSKCSKDNISQKKYNEQKRQSNYDYLHKRINDMLRNRNDMEEANIFFNESCYYRDLVRGKIPEPNPNYTEPIKTKSDYKKWLEKKHNHYLKRPRKNPPAI
ncbi:MAG: hypothetical protein HFG66_00910 [Hungatella sp.]|nr:hypothetical protein [Hungatella sp.]